jgi:RNA-splicing ligase RtcB
MSRSQAQKKLDLATEIKEMEDAGVVHALRSTADLAEAKGSYKDVVQVMAYQTDLVDIDTELFTLGVLKGEEEERGKKKKLSAAERDMDVELTGKDG